MIAITRLYHHNKGINNSILMFSVYCFGLLLVRAKITQSIYLFFLIWNLMLAVIPYLISAFISMNLGKQKKWHTTFYALFWLVFLPNSFYIVTDLVHIIKSKGTLFYLDLIIISSFALTGFFLGVLSILEMEKTSLRLNFKAKIIQYVLIVICFLNGFGIYIGRELRFNSWDIVSNPAELFSTLSVEVLSKETIYFSLLFGTFIYLALCIYQNVTLNPKINVADATTNT